MKQNDSLDFGYNLKGNKLLTAGPFFAMVIKKLYGAPPATSFNGQDYS